MAILLFDSPIRKSLLPLTATRAIAALRFGLLSIQERWGIQTKSDVYIQTENYLQILYPLPESKDNIWVDAAVVADSNLLQKIIQLELGSCLFDKNGLVAGRWESDDFSIRPTIDNFSNKISLEREPKRIRFCWDLMLWNDAMIREDFKIVTEGRKTEPIPQTVQCIAPENVFIEAGAKLSYCILNASTGPIYIGKDAEVMEGTCIRGPFSLGYYSVLKMNSRIYGATSLGPCCMGGGEIKNSVIMGYSNKAHDGYLGDAVIGEWCNLGAGSTNSNVKNTAGEVKVWNYASNSYLGVGQKCGLIMGDYSRVAINSAVNTGTIVGVSCNVFGPGLLPTIFNNFSWGTTGNRYDFKKAVFAIDNWKKMKQQSLTDAETSILETIFAQNL